MSVIWITGLAGAGKTTIAREVERLLAAQDILVTLLDGDAVRKRFGDTAYDRAGRLAAAYRLSRLAAEISAAGQTVVVATISLFHEIQSANRTLHADYLEVFVQCDAATLQRRSPLYGRDIDASLVGRGIPAEFPVAPHLVLDSGDASRVDALARRIVERWTTNVGIR